MRKAGLSLALGLLLVPALLAAQSLGEVAAQERARRAKEKEKGGKQAKVFTDSDLPAKTPGDKPADAGAAPAPAEEPSVPPSERPAGVPANEAEQGPEAMWRGRAAQARQGLEAAQQAIASAEADVDRIKQDLNPMSTTFSQDTNVLQRRQSELTQAQARAEAARQGLVVAQKAYDDFLEQARRENVPPGWVRQ